MRDLLETLATSVPREDVENDRGFGRIDHTLDVSIASNVVVAERAAAGHVPSRGLEAHGFVRFGSDCAAVLGGELAFEDARDVRFEGAVSEALRLRVEPHLNVLRELRQFAEGLVTIATTKAVLRLHDHDVERTRVR